MKKCILISTFGLFAILSVFSQQTSQTKSDPNFVSISSEMKENGKIFYAVDMSKFSNENKRAEFMEMVYAEKRMFPVSTIRDNKTWLLCGFESVISANEAITLLNNFNEKATGNTVSSSTVEKVKTNKR